MSKLFDPARVTPEGRELGQRIARLVQPEIDALAAEGEPDQRCTTCAFRAGTVPNGCPQTQMDALKCVIQGDRRFMCHQDTSRQTICYGFLAMSIRTSGIPRIKVPWDYSPDPTEDEAREAAEQVAEHAGLSDQGGAEHD